MKKINKEINKKIIINQHDRRSWRERMTKPARSSWKYSASRMILLPSLRTLGEW